jgi:hypothetical protein
MNFDENEKTFVGLIQNYVYLYLHFLNQTRISLIKYEFYQLLFSVICP